MAITRNELAQYRQWKAEETKIINNLPVRFRDVCVHEIQIGDVEDPGLYVAEPIWKWQQTLAGKFVMEHAVEKPYWVSNIDTATYGYKYRIFARLSEQNETFWRLMCSDK